ncbi:hypothetical protein AALA24_03250 [Anaerovoracaceae bacterium 42-11]
MSIYKYNSEIEFDLPYGYKHVTEEFDEVGMCECIAYGPKEGVCGDTLYDFYLLLHTVSISKDLPQFRGFSSDEVLHNLRNENGMKYIITNVAHPIKLALQGRLLSATLQFAGIDLWIPVSSDNLLFLSTGVTNKRDEEVKIYLPNMIEHILKIAQGISINGKKLDISGLDADKLAKVLMPAFDDAKCENVTDRLYGKTEEGNAEGCDSLKRKNDWEKVAVDDYWSIGLPNGWSYRVNGAQQYLLQMQDGIECDFNQRYGSPRSLVINSAIRPVNALGDLTSQPMQKEIKNQIEAYENARARKLEELFRDDSLKDVLEEVDMTPKDYGIEKVRHDSNVALYYTGSNHQDRGIRSRIYLFLRNRDVYYCGDIWFEGETKQAEKLLSDIANSIEITAVVDKDEKSTIDQQDIHMMPTIDFANAEPKEELYPHYLRLKSTVENSIPSTISVVNAQGTEYQMIALRDMMRADEDWEDDNEFDRQEAAKRRETYERIIGKDVQTYYLAEKAEEMRLLFHVNDDAFDSCHDRESELAEGLMHRAYMMSALRSFAWTLADYCKENNLQPREISYEILQQIAAFIASKKWLNYDGDSYCKGLCGSQDIHVYYVPEAISEDEKKVLYPGKEELEYHENLKKLHGSWGTKMQGSVLSDVASLEVLREDLNYIYPAVKVLYKELAKTRNFDEPLTGNEADILYGWCAMAYAAREPFFTEDGPMRCSFGRKSK